MHETDGDVTYIGRTDFRGAQRLFGIKRNDRRQHMYVVGKTGTGKSTLLNNLITQDISNGEGICVIDPHGELVKATLEHIPEERLQDVIYFNPADPDNHIGFNILEIPDPQYKHLVASGLMGIFTKIWAGTWSARMEYILNNCVLALIDTPGSTLMGIPRLLVDKEYRQQIVDNVTDPVVRAFWISEYEAWDPKFRSEAISPIQNKVGQFLSTGIIRNIVGQSKSTIDIYKLMNEGKIFLVNLSKGELGEDNSALLGGMLITKIQLSAMERIRIPNEDERVDFYLYVDEFQNFATDSFASILSEARKYRLNLIVAHQYIGQLVTDTSTKVRDAIFGNVGTMILFRVGAADAEFLENEFEPEFVIQDIVNIPNYHIFLKLMVSGVATRPFSAETLPPFKAVGIAVGKEQIIETSRKKYARPRYLVEQEINQRSGVMHRGGASSFGTGGASGFRRGGEGGPPGARTGAPGSFGGASRPNAGPPRQDAGVLAGMGIEFRKTTPTAPMGGASTRPLARPNSPRPPSGAPPTSSFSRPAAPPVRRPKITAEEVVRQPKGDAASSLSLSSLKPREAKEVRDDGHNENVDIDAIRKAISDALNTSQKDRHQEQQSDDKK